MLGVGWTEMLVIGVVALIVIGPKELPAVMRRVGQFAGTIRRMGQDFQRELNKTTGLNEITNLRNSVTAPLKATADAIRKEFNATTATGTVVPSGAIKPADPTAQSVVEEIKAQAGMTPAAPAVSAAPVVDTTAVAPVAAVAATPAATVAATPAAVVADAAPKKPRAPRVKPVPAAVAVETAELPAAAPAAKRSRKVAAIESPAPAEALPPVEVATPAKRTRKAAAPVTVAEPEAEQKPKRTRRVAAKPADSKTDES